MFEGVPFRGGVEISRAFLEEVALGDNERDCLRLEAGVVGTGRMETLRSLRDRSEGGAEVERCDEGAVRREAS